MSPAVRTSINGSDFSRPEPAPGACCAPSHRAEDFRMGWFPSSLFRRKDVGHLLDEMNAGDRLHRRLGPVALTALGVGATIGTGLYVQTGRVANELTGPSIILSFLLAAVGCGFAALC